MRGAATSDDDEDEWTRWRCAGKAFGVSVKPTLVDAKACETARAMTVPWATPIDDEVCRARSDMLDASRRRGKL